MKKSGKPEFNELVVCRITTINPNSAFAKLVEYENLTGMIHVSEVARRWVRNIREFLKENQYLVCTIMKIDGNHISLSAKRVSDEQASRKMNEFKREQKSLKMLEILAKNMHIDFEKIQDNIGYPLQESFGSVSKALDIAFKNEDLFRKRSELEKKWSDAVIDLVKRNYSEKVYILKSELNLITYKEEGVEIIKKVLLASQKSGFEVKYISAPKYTISKSGKNFKEIQSSLEAESQRISKEIEKNQGVASFEVESRARK
ncbi:MAG: hypothetical protein JW716_01800 [Candidatus Aenigmarchaeota archaeon]|nr:hypothetical protein [Candidatus Aenigmarchaeota archaeon]